MRWLTSWMILSALLAGCGPSSSDGFASDDDASDDDTDGDCSTYRSQYPGGPYGTTVGSVLEDFPGMVDSQDDPRHVEEFFTDTSKLVLVIANAFDT